MNDQRPTPDSLLKEAESETKGKFKIFLGAAPGVGKTYAMLSAAKSRKAEGIDTVIGIVETHQRSDTAQMAESLESIPRQKLDYRGRVFDEMDLDAILARKPQLVLIDELAHTNTPGARHPKRYQDVQEILDAGIDVYSTLNVQHIESLNDIVARITGVTVRETVPDTIIQSANNIELIDLPAEELLQRLKDGKVYIPEQARLAVNRFFTPGNLTALRELALRQAAERVDDQMTHYMRRHAISGPWPTAQRILVCITDDRQAVSLVRTARRTADRRQAPWLVLYIETARHNLLSESTRGDIAQAMNLAASMGAETLTIASEDVAGEIVRLARDKNVSTIMLGKSARGLISRLIRPSVATAVLKQSDGFDILLVHPTERMAEKERRHAPRQEFWSRHRAAFGRAAFIIFIASVIAWALQPFMSTFYLPFFYIIAILLIAVDHGLAACLFGVALSAAVMTLLMNAPAVALWPHRREDIITLLFFIPIGAAIGYVGDYLHRQVDVTRQNARRAQALYEFNKIIAATATVDDIARATVQRVAEDLKAKTALFMPRGETLTLIAAEPEDLKLDTTSNAAMDWAWRHDKPAGWKSDTLPAAEFFGLPMKAGDTTVGILAVRPEDEADFSADKNLFLLSIAYQAASALARARLASDVAQARLQTETERLRASLLSSISHDLRTPLDAILSAAHALDSAWEETSIADRRGQVRNIGQDAARLERFVRNLLDMTDLVTGHMTFLPVPTDIRHVLTEAVQSTRLVSNDHAIVQDYPDALPTIMAAPDLLKRTCINLIENACLYAPTGTRVILAARADDDNLILTVDDEGPGIPISERIRIFDMFYRMRNVTAAGQGLGLSICRGFIERHRGSIHAETGPNNRGTRVVIKLPLAS